MGRTSWFKRYTFEGAIVGPARLRRVYVCRSVSREGVTCRGKIEDGSSATRRHLEWPRPESL